MLATVLALIVVPVGLNQVWTPLTGRSLPIAGALQQAVAPLLIANPYGVFAVMTTTRPEIVIEGSDDGKTWREYVLPYKPAPSTARPPGTSPTSPASTGNCGLRRSRGSAGTCGSGAWCRGCSRGARRCWAYLSTTRFPIIRPSTCAPSSTTIALPRQVETRGGSGAWRACISRRSASMRL